MPRSRYAVSIALFLALSPGASAAALAAPTPGPEAAEVDKLNAQIDTLLRAGKFNDALPIAKRVLALRETSLGPTDPLVADALMEIASIYGNERDYADAQPVNERALAILEKTRPDSPELGEALYNLAILRAVQSDATGAEKLFLRALSVREKAFGPDHTAVAQVATKLADLYAAVKVYDGAAELYARALRIVERAFGEDHPGVIETMLALANVLTESGDYARAAPLYLRALAIEEKARGPETNEAATILNNLASLYESTGQYAKAQPLYERALAILTKLLGPDHVDVATTTTSLATVLATKGEYARAEPLYLRALGIHEKAYGADGIELAVDLNNMGELYEAKQEFPRAEAAFTRALAIREKQLSAKDAAIGMSLNNLASLYLAEGSAARALPLLERALAVFTDALGQAHPRVGNAFNNLAAAHDDLGEDAKAEPLYLRAIALWESSLGPSHPDVASARENLGFLYWARGDAPRALEQLRRAGEITDANLDLVLATGSEEAKRAYVATVENRLDTALSFHTSVAPKDPQATRFALETLLARKGRILDAMTDSTGALRRRASPEDRALLDALSVSREHLAQVVLHGEDDEGASPEQRQARLRELKEQVSQLESKVSARSAEFRVVHAKVTLEAVRAGIPEGGALVELVAYAPFDAKGHDASTRWGQKRRYAAYVLAGGAPRDVAWVDLGEADGIDAAVAALRESLAKPSRDDVKALARALDERVMRPIRPLLGDARRIFLSPDSALNLVPFGALVDEDDHYLVERYAFTYLTSGRDVLRFRESIPARSEAVVLANPDFDAAPAASNATEVAPGKRGSSRRSAELAGAQFPPLPGTAEEAVALAAVLHGARVLTQRDATEQALLDVHGPRVLHIATHGFFLDDEARDMGDTRGLVLDARARPHAKVGENPLLRSGIALAGANKDATEHDGVVTALEASGLDLWGTKLVVLSACETGVGDVRRGDGVYGLRRALVIAGAESTVMSLWKVDDEGTRDLMVDYYTRLAAGGGRSEALRQAQLAMLASQRHPHPYFWASFIPSGDWRSLDEHDSAPSFAKVLPGARGCACESAPRASSEGGVLGVWLMLAAGAAAVRLRRR